MAEHFPSKGTIRTERVGRDVAEKLLDAISDSLDGNQRSPRALLMLAEAYAWVANPAQTHGGAPPGRK